MSKTGKYKNVEASYKGKKVDSKLEVYCLYLLDQFKIPYETQVPIEITPAHTNWDGRRVQNVDLIVDVIIKVNGITIYLDPKGYPTDVSKNKYKALSYRCVRDGIPHEIHLPKDRKEVNSTVINIFTKHFKNKQNVTTS